MPYFVVGYDIKEENDSQPIRDALEELDSCHTQDSVWYVDRSGTARQLRDHLSAHIEDNDLLMVVEFTKRPSWTKAKHGTQAWVDARFP